MFTILLNDMIKDTDEQTDGEKQRVRAGKVLRTRASVPMELRYITHTPPLLCVCSPTWKFSEPHTIQFHGDFLP